MKKLIFALAAVVALAACSKEETISLNQGAPIGFDTFVENATRSVNDPSLNAVSMQTKGFGVYGFVTKADTAPLFTNEKVYFDGVWKYDNIQYWIDGATYDFAAIAPYDADSDVYSNVTATTGGVKLTFTNDGVTDLLYAQRNGVEGPDSEGAVGFTFNHVLSKVKFSFVNGYNATNSSIQVRDIKILNAHEQASVALSSAAPVWNQGSVAGALELNFGDATDNEATVDVEGTTVDFECDDTYESYNELLLIPGAAKKLADEDLPGYKVTFIVDVLMNDVVIATYNHTAYADFVPVAGSRYDIKTTITAENIDPENEQTPIEFTVTAVNDWTNGGEKKAEIVTE